MNMNTWTAFGAQLNHRREPGPDKAHDGGIETWNVSKIESIIGVLSSFSYDNARYHTMLEMRAQSEYSKIQDADTAKNAPWWNTIAISGKVPRSPSQVISKSSNRWLLSLPSRSSEWLGSRVIREYQLSWNRKGIQYLQTSIVDTNYGTCKHIRKTKQFIDINGKWYR